KMQQADPTDNITSVSAQSLIRLRQLAAQLPLQSGKIHARQGGAYQSSFKGRGMEFEESRIYLPGDDIRNMDWRVTARTGTAHTKVFEEERERPVILWLDLNDPMFFATRGAYKSVIATRAAALIAWSACNNNDRLGALVFAGDEHSEIRPRRGKSAVLDLVGNICKHSAWQRTAAQRQATTPRQMDKAMARLRKVARPGSLIFMFSDFRDDSGNTLNGSSRAHLVNTARHNDVVLVQVYDPLEAGLPPPGHYRLSDGTRDIQLNTRDDKLRQHYHQRFEHHQESLRKLCQQHRMYLLPLCTQDDVLSSLQLGLGIRAGQHSQFRAAT
ncbi:MAG: DUF58 domain-containing protein, partial [Gammaproteobacteria bacterium]